MPDLSYATGKLRKSLERIHGAYLEASRLRKVVQPPYREGWPDSESFVPTCAYVQWNLKYALQNLLVGLCELHGMMEIFANNEEAIVDRLLLTTHAEFKDWLDRFEHNGELSVNGWKE